MWGGFIIKNYDIPTVYPRKIHRDAQLSLPKATRKDAYVTGGKLIAVPLRTLARTHTNAYSTGIVNEL
jgi:hypothetical protein